MEGVWSRSLGGLYLDGLLRCHMSFGSMSVILWMYERAKQGIASEPKKTSPINDPMPTQVPKYKVQACTRYILNHDFLNQHT